MHLTTSHIATAPTRGSKTDDSRIRAEAMAMVERCPSGALIYAVIPDGPLWVSGRIEVTRTDGSTLETRNRVPLWRCGQSASKPLCDGSHKEAGFTG